jgi:uncharacterized protein (TIGR03663 family)
VAEHAYVTTALAGLSWAVMVFAGPRQGLPGTARFLARHRWDILGGVAVAVLVAVPLYTVLFAHPEDWFFPGRAISYWWGQHSIARVAGPWWYHLPRLALYEFLTIAAALVWVARRRRRLRRIELALLVFGLLSVAMYAYLREKVGWLGVHQVWAFLPLAGMQLARTFSGRGRWWSRTLAGTALAATALVSVVASFVLDEISPNLRRVESLIYVQTCPSSRRWSRMACGCIGRAWTRWRQWPASPAGPSPGTGAPRPCGGTCRRRRCGRRWCSATRSRRRRRAAGSGPATPRSGCRCGPGG